MNAPPFLIADDGKSITCLVCGRTSWSLGDVQHEWCENCKRSHDDPEQIKAFQLTPMLQIAKRATDNGTKEADFHTVLGALAHYACEVRRAIKQQALADIRDASEIEDPTLTEEQLKRLQNGVCYGIALHNRSIEELLNQGLQTTKKGSGA